MEKLFLDIFYPELVLLLEYSVVFFYMVEDIAFQLSLSFSEKGDFSLDILVFSKGSKIEVAQGYVIELKALSDIIVLKIEDRGLIQESHNGEALGPPD